jgi:hypothetical protein
VVLSTAVEASPGLGEDGTNVVMMRSYNVKRGSGAVQEYEGRYVHSDVLIKSLIVRRGVLDTRVIYAEKLLSVNGPICRREEFKGFKA